MNRIDLISLPNDLNKPKTEEKKLSLSLSLMNPIICFSSLGNNNDKWWRWEKNSFDKMRFLFWSFVVHRLSWRSEKKIPLSFYSLLTIDIILWWYNKLHSLRMDWSTERYLSWPSKENWSRWWVMIIRIEMNSWM